MHKQQTFISMFLQAARSSIKALLDLLGNEVLGSHYSIAGWILHLPVCERGIIFRVAEDQNNLKHS